MERFILVCPQVYTVVVIWRSHMMLDEVEVFGSVLCPS